MGPRSLLDPDDAHSHETPKGFDALRSRGLRATQQRQLIWSALAADPDAHLSAEDLVERVRERLPGVDPSTIYRTLDLLVREGLVSRTDLGADRAFFEPAREHAHHHVVCTSCGFNLKIHKGNLYINEPVNERPAYSH